MKNTLLYGLAALAAGCASIPEAMRPDPADPKPAVSGPTYRSAFEGYVGFREQELADWRHVNDEVAKAAKERP